MTNLEKIYFTIVICQEPFFNNSFFFNLNKRFLENQSVKEVKAQSQQH